MECCNSDSGKGMKEMMKECMKKCRWCPLIPMTLGIISFLLGYFLDAEIVRILWLIFSGFGILMGTFCLIMMSLTIKKGG